MAAGTALLPKRDASTTAEAPLVSICICTFRREIVADTVRSLVVQRGVASTRFEIVVCDDDPANSARHLVEELAATSSIPIRYVSSGAGNVAICRNKCLASAGGEWIAFIDDDETAEADWLDQLLKAQAEFDADVVKGFVRAQYPETVPRWVLAGDPFTRDHGPTGTVLTYCGAGNVLFRRSLALEHDVAFDADFGPIGGEDTDFFLRLGERGAVMISCRTAVVNEIVPPSRVTMGYLSRRFYRYGQGYAQIFVSPRSRAGRAISLARSLIGIAVGAPFGLARLVSAAAAFRMFRLLCFHLGVVGWALGRRSVQME